jgi:4-alpha-glucanotransferase
MSEGGQRRAGILLHPTSLPSPYGPGDIGHAAYRFVEFLAAAGCSLWQMLPVVPPHRDLSPYDALSAFAGNPALISLDWLHDRGLLDVQDLARVRASPGERDAVLACAAGRFAATPEHPLHEGFPAFRERHGHWLADYALFVALREARAGEPWFRWPQPLRDREAGALQEARSLYAARIDAICFGQYVFGLQWQELASYARGLGVEFFGDVPIFVARDSADVWAMRHLFRIEGDGSLAVETGVPPDYFSADGQRWGNPHYDWAAMAADGFDWWRQRISLQRERFAMLRIDHFRGFEACWEVPRAARTAAEGHWAPAPGHALLAALVDAAGQGRLAAEDLGTITPEVHALRLAHGLPGMLVLQFAFDGNARNPYLPHNHAELAVVYSGTHDNDTTLGWFRSLGPSAQESVLAYFGQRAEDMPRTLVRAAFASVARVAIVPMQDLLALGSEARMNVPGVATGNWNWQLPEGSGFDAALARRLREMLAPYGRLPHLLRARPQRARRNFLTCVIVHSCVSVETATAGAFGRMTAWNTDTTHAWMPTYRRSSTDAESPLPRRVSVMPAEAACSFPPVTPSCVPTSTSRSSFPWTIPAAMRCVACARRCAAASAPVWRSNWTTAMPPSRHRCAPC